MALNPYKGVQDLTLFIKEKVNLPPIPLHYIIITESQSNLEQSKLNTERQEQNQLLTNVVTTRLRDQNSCCFYCFFPLLQFALSVYRTVEMIFNSPLMIPGIIWGVSAFFFLIGVCFVCTNQPNRKFGTIMKLFIVFIVIDLISLAYAAIYFATNSDQDENCKQVKETNIFTNQVSICHFVENHYWLFFSLIASGIIYFVSIITIIAIYCKNRSYRGIIRYAPAQTSEMQVL